MENPEWVQRCLSDFERQTEPFMEVAVAESLKAARSSQGNLDDASWSAFLAEFSAFMFCERADEDSLWGTYFAPMAEFTTLDGKKTVNPDLADLTPETVRHWEERAAAVENPILKARYADCVWDLERKISKTKRQHQYAIIAVKSYIKVARNDGFTNEANVAAGIVRALNITGVHMLARAVQLARSINQPNLAAEAAIELIAFCERHGDPSHAGIWLAPFDTLYDQKGLLTSDQRDKIINDLECMLARTSNAEGGKDFNPFGAQSAAERLVRHYNKLEQTQRLVQTYGLAFEIMARDASPMLAMAWMQPVVERYEQVRLTAESERLANAIAEKGKRIGEDLKTYTVEIPIDREVVDKGTDAILAGSELNLKLLRIGLEFTPRAATAKKILESAREHAPLLTMIPQNIVTMDGQTTARVGSLDDDLEGRLQKQTADNIGGLQLFLRHVLTELKRRDTPTTEQIVGVLYACPLFSDRRKEVIREGVSAYLAQDWVKAIHVLIPQMEEILRNLLAGVGVPVSKALSNNPGVTVLKNMGDALNDERIKSILGEDRWRYLSALYTDRRGINLRNNVAHGLVPAEGFNPYTADLVFHSFLAIASLRKAS